MSRRTEIKKEIKEYWFKNHKAELVKCGDITILNWRNPESGNYYVRYIFDGYRMYISGDIGDAVFSLTWKATLESFTELDLDYFLSKMTTCSNGKERYCSEKASARLKEWKAELLEDKIFENDEEKEEFLEMFDDLISGAENCTSIEQWAWEYVNSDTFNEFISENHCDYWEWIYNIGTVIPYHNFAYLIGLKMAYEQLKENNSQ